MIDEHLEIEQRVRTSVRALVPHWTGTASTCRPSALRKTIPDPVRDQVADLARLCPSGRNLN